MRIWLQLIRRDLTVFFRQYIDKFIDTFLLFAIMVVVFAYFMPSLGLAANFGPFLMIGSLASFGFLAVVMQANELITDIRGERKVSYLLMLPLSSFAVFSYMAVSWGLQSLLIAAPLLFIGKLLLWNSFDLAAISWARLIPIFIIAHLFYGYFALWMAGLLKNMSDISKIYFRFCNPLYFFGAFFYSWLVSYQLSPIIGVISLADPLVYVMEGTRAAALGQEGFIPFWICPIALIGFTIVCGWDGIRRLRKNLDCV